MKNIVNDVIHCFIQTTIEFNGDVFHASPKMFKKDDVPLSFLNMTALQIWEKDNTKNTKVINKGYEILTIWENEYKNNCEQTINV